MRGAQPGDPSVSVAHTVPLQQTSWADVQAAPAAAQAGSGGACSGGAQIKLPGLPTQVPPQQSSVAVHGAPVGAQPLRQASVPVVSGKHRWPQQSSSSAQG